MMKMSIVLVLVFSLLSQSMGLGDAGCSVADGFRQDRIMLETLFCEGRINENVKMILGDVYTDQLTRGDVFLASLAFQEILRVARGWMAVSEKELIKVNEHRLINLYRNLINSLKLKGYAEEVKNIIRNMILTLIRKLEEILKEYIIGDIAHHEGGAYRKKIYNSGWKSGKSKGIIYGEDITYIYGDWDIGYKKLRDKIDRKYSLEVREIKGGRSLKPLSVIKLEGNKIIISRRMLELLRKISMYMKAEDYKELIDAIYIKYVIWPDLRYMGRRFNAPGKTKLLDRFEKYRKDWDIEQYDKINSSVVSDIAGQRITPGLYSLRDRNKDILMDRLFHSNEAGLLKSEGLFEDLLDLINRKLPRKSGYKRYGSGGSESGRDSKELTGAIHKLGKPILYSYNKYDNFRFNKLLRELVFLGIYGKTEYAAKACFQLGYINRQLLRNRRIEDALRVAYLLQYIILNSDNDKVIIEAVDVFGGILISFYGLPLSIRKVNNFQRSLQFILETGKNEYYSDKVRLVLVDALRSFVSSVAKKRFLDSDRINALVDIGSEMLLIARNFKNYERLLPIRAKEEYLGEVAFNVIEFIARVLADNNNNKEAEQLIDGIIKTAISDKYDSKLRCIAMNNLSDYIGRTDKSSNCTKYELEEIDRIVSKLCPLSKVSESYNELISLNGKEYYLGNRALTPKGYAGRILLLKEENAQKEKGLKYMYEIIDILASCKYSPKMRFNAVTQFQSFFSRLEDQEADINGYQLQVINKILATADIISKDPSNYIDIIDWEIDNIKHSLGSAAVGLRRLAASVLLSKGRKNEALKLIDEIIEMPSSVKYKPKIRFGVILQLHWLIGTKSGKAVLNEGEEDALDKIASDEKLGSIWKDLKNYSYIIYWEVKDRKEYLGVKTMDLKKSVAEVFLNKDNETEGLRFIDDLIQIVEDPGYELEQRFGAVRCLIAFVNKKKEQRDLNESEEKALIKIATDKKLDSAWKSYYTYVKKINWKTDNTLTYLGREAASLKIFAADVLKIHGKENMETRQISQSLQECYKQDALEQAAKSAINAIGSHLLNNGTFLTQDEAKDLEFIKKASMGEIEGLSVFRQGYALGQIQGIIIKMFKKGMQREAEGLIEEILVPLFNDKNKDEMIRAKAASEIAGVILGHYIRRNIYNRLFRKYIEILCEGIEKEEGIVLVRIFLILRKIVRNLERREFDGKEEMLEKINRVIKKKRIYISKNTTVYKEIRDKNNEIIYVKILKGPRLESEGIEGVYETYYQHKYEFSGEKFKFKKLSNDSFDCDLFLINIIDIIINKKSSSDSPQNLYAIKECLGAA